MASNSTLTPVSSRGWTAGFGNLWEKEMHDWFRTRTWWVQTLIWLVIINGFVLLILLAPMPDMTVQSGDQTFSRIVTDKGLAALSIFFQIGGYATAMGVAIIAQDKMVGEKRSGTAEWVLSKPVSRHAFILAKLLGNLPGILLFMVIIQGLIAIIQVTVYRGTMPALLPFLTGIGMLSICLVFYLSLSIMLGSISNNRGLVVGIPLVLILGDTILMQIMPFLQGIMPWTLPKAAALLVSDQPVPPAIIVPVLATLLWSAVFTGVALWRFAKEEF